MVNICRTDAPLRGKRRYSFRCKTQESYLSESAVASLGHLSETGLYDPMHPLFDAIFHSNSSYRSVGILIPSLLQVLLSNNSSNKHHKSTQKIPVRIKTHQHHKYLQSLSAQGIGGAPMVWTGTAQKHSRLFGKNTRKINSVLLAGRRYFSLLLVRFPLKRHPN